MKINESIENYLERILMLSKKNGAVRSVDIAIALNVTKASVSHAMKLLRQNGYILMDKNNYITLTEAGNEIAERMLERHQMLAEFLIRLGVSENTAYEDSCKIEHSISDESFDAICRHAKNGSAIQKSN